MQSICLSRPLSLSIHRVKVQVEEEVRNSTDLPATQFFISSICKTSPEHLLTTSDTPSELEFTAQSSVNLELQPVAR